MKKFNLTLFTIFLFIGSLHSQISNEGWDKVFPLGIATYAIKTDGSLWVLSSGASPYINFYDGEHIVIKANPQQVNNEKWKGINWGGSGEVRLKVDGTLWYCGSNQFGTLGDGTDKSGPGRFRQIGNDNDWSSFVSSHITFAIKENGTLWAWGYNMGSFGDESIPISKGFHPQPITQIGSDADWETVAMNLDGSSVNYINVIALKTDGSMWGWGSYGDDLGLNLPYNGLQKTPKKIIDGKWRIVSRENWGTAAIRSDGTLWIWGDASKWLFAGEQILDSKFPEQYGKDTDWQTICVGRHHILALKTDGTLWSAGRENIYGEIGNGSKKPVKRLIQIGKDTDWEKIFAGNQTSFGIKKDGSLWSWGENGSGQLGHGGVLDYIQLVDKGLSMILVPTKIE